MKFCIHLWGDDKHTKTLPPWPFCGTKISGETHEHAAGHRAIKYIVLDLLRRCFFTVLWPIFADKMCGRGELRWRFILLHCCIFTNLHKNRATNGAKLWNLLCGFEGMYPCKFWLEGVWSLNLVVFFPTPRQLMRTSRRQRPKNKSQESLHEVTRSWGWKREAFWMNDGTNLRNTYTIWGIHINEATPRGDKATNAVCHTDLGPSIR